MSGIDETLHYFREERQKCADKADCVGQDLPEFHAAMNEAVHHMDAAIAALELARSPEGGPAETVANHICAAAPEGYIVNLSMEHGAAWVELWQVEGEHGASEIKLPDAADKSLWEQLQDALAVAAGSREDNEDAPQTPASEPPLSADDLAARGFPAPGGIHE